MTDVASSQVETKIVSLQAWVTAGLCFIVVFAVSIMGIMVWTAVRVGENARDLAAVAEETHDALCAFKVDLTKRWQGGVAFVKENPSGLRDARGEIIISRDQLDTSNANQRAALDALRRLDCTT